MTLRNSQNETASALLDALKEIRKAQEPCRLLLSELAEARMRPEKVLRGGGHSSDAIIDRLLRFLGFVLYRVANHLTPGELPEFYFWPGYNSIIGENAPRRIQITPANFPAIAGGLGFEPTALHLTQQEYADRLTRGDYYGAGDYDLSDTSLWFDCVLSSEHKDYSGDTPLIVGGTHQWVTNGNIMLSDRSPLEVLSVCVGEPYRDAAAGDPYRPQEGRIHIPLDTRTFFSWGGKIAEVLNDKKNVTSEYKWPTPNDISLVKAYLCDPYGINITYRLYGLWLKSNFDPGWRVNNVDVMIDDIRKLGEWKGLTKLADRVEAMALARVNGHTFLNEALREAGYTLELLETFSRLDKREYRYWYTLVLKKTANIPDLENIPTDLGSAMVLSSHELPEVFFDIIKPWIESIYLEIRTVETSILLKEMANLDGRLKQARQFAHQTSGLITTPWLDENRTQLSDWSQFSLWMAKTLITQIWGTTTVKYDEQIQEDYLEWAGLEPREVLARIVDLSLEYAIQRATKASQKTKNKDLDNFNWEFMRSAVRMSDADDRVPRLRERLGLSLPPGQPMEWMEYKAFVLFFYHTLWQAAHHALRASSADEGLAPYLWMEWNASSLTIYNRAPSSIPVTLSPKDKDFFKRLSERYRKPYETSGPFEVTGPEPVKQEQADAPPVWRTTIHFRG